MTWHAYFDENETKTWTTYRFHKNWIRINEKDHENLVYGKAVDTLVKSLREIANKSLDHVKIQASICLYMGNVYRNNLLDKYLSGNVHSNNLLDNCCCPQQGRHDF